MSDAEDADQAGIPAIDPEIIAYALGLAPDSVQPLLDGGDIATAIVRHEDPDMGWTLTCRYRGRLLRLAADRGGTIRELSVEPDERAPRPVFARPPLRPGAAGPAVQARAAS